MKPEVVRRIAATFALVTFALGSAPPAAAAAAAGLTGRILASEGRAPVPGAVLTLREQGTGKEFESAPSDAGGVYRIEGLPPGRFDLSVRAGEVDFEMPEPVVVTGPGALSLSVALEPPPEGAPPEASKASGKAERKKEKKSRSGRKGTVKGKAISIASVVGGAVVLGAVQHAAADDEGSPSTP